MRITEIKYSQRKNLGNYEHRELGFTVALDEHEKSAPAIEKVRDLLDWEINRPERESNHAAYTKRLAEIAEIKGEEKIDKERGQIERWLAKYTEQKARIEAIAH